MRNPVSMRGKKFHSQIIYKDIKGKIKVSLPSLPNSSAPGVRDNLHIFTKMVCAYTSTPLVS